MAFRTLDPERQDIEDSFLEILEDPDIKEIRKHWQ